MRKITKPLVFAVLAIGIMTTGSLLRTPSAFATEEAAILAGGCFWCVESDFDHVPGVLKTTSGYIGGEKPDPTYKFVSAGGSGYLEAVEIVFDPEKISYAGILEIFWRSIDPTDDGGQFCDRGESYKTAIFATSEIQKTIAEKSKAALIASGILKTAVVTAIREATAFYPAEDYHQDYYEKNPVRYKFYRFSCGRDAKIKAIWGDQAHRGIMDR